MIREISFENFRRFEKFPTMTLGPINIFVGRNNSGKSTVLKAIQLINANAICEITKPTTTFGDGRPAFTFDLHDHDGLNIDTFERALYKKAKKKEITLAAKYDTGSIQVVLDGVSTVTNEHIAIVPYSSIKIKTDILELSYDFKTRDLEFTIKQVPTEDEVEESKYQLRKLEEQRFDIESSKWEAESEMENIELDIEDSDKVDPAVLGDKLIQLGKLKKVTNQLKKELKSVDKLIDEYKIAETKVSHVKIENLNIDSSESTLPPLFRILFALYNYKDSKTEGKANTKKYKEEQSRKETVKEVFNLLEKECKKVQQYTNLHFIHAHAASQKVIYLKDDKSDKLSSVLSDFYNAKIDKGSEAGKFVEKWMGEAGFEIGDNYAIEPVEGAGYLLKIIEDGERYNLADKGTGSIQLMTMLLTLSLILNSPSDSSIILIEEPEQNIHPQLQSKLADMFLDFQQKLCENTTWEGDQSEAMLIIETHSEYLIRRSQVLVSNENYKDEEDLNENNPFHVFYFDKDNKDEPVYEMEYETTGGFKKQFGTGFYDEASKLDLHIMQKEKEVQKNMSKEELFNKINGLA